MSNIVIPFAGSDGKDFRIDHIENQPIVVSNIALNDRQIDIKTKYFTSNTNRRVSLVVPAADVSANVKMIVELR